jgi:ABC-type lipoprotein export system ATPase subunit
LLHFLIIIFAIFTTMLKSTSLGYRYPNGKNIEYPAISCQAGAVLLVLGPSGVGKTTLLHLLGGLLRPTVGTIQLHQQNLERLSEAQLDAFRGQHIGIIFQKSHFLAALSIHDNFKVAAPDATTSEIEHLAQALGIASLLHKLPAQLSQGEQQRASIARALLRKPSLLLADEPTASLDDENALAVAQLLAKQAQEQQAALLIVTHDTRLKQLFENHIYLS